MNDELEVLADFRGDVPAPDDATTQLIYRLATTTRPKRQLQLRRRTDRGRLIVCVAAAALAVVVTASALAIHYFGPSPGFTAGFSALDNVPAAPPPSEELLPASVLERMSQVMGVSPAEFTSRLRRLQTGLSLGPGRTQGQGELFAYVGKDGSACLLLTGQGGNCILPENIAHFPGVDATVFPGYPGQTPAVAAIVADNVDAVQLSVGDRRTTLPIINNSVYANLDGLRPEDAIALHATYDDGTCRTTPLPNPTGANNFPSLTPHEGC
jgi:hypothetical protein